MDLRADCDRCSGLCCVGPGFTASADFAIDKPAGTPCPHLTAGDRCEIHQGLASRGFPGCVAFDCLGAGQRITALAGRVGWRHPTSGPAVLAAFASLHGLHEAIWHLRWAAGQVSSWPALVEQVGAAQADVEALAAGGVDTLAALDVVAVRRRVGVLLGEVSDTLRAPVADRGPDRPGAELIGRDLRHDRLAGTSLRGARLIGADLRGVDLDRTDLLGADLRAARLEGARLRDALFLTPPQVAASVGDGTTTLPAGIDRPAHWA